MNVRRRAPMRIRARPDRAKFVLSVRADFHPAVQAWMTRVVLRVVIAGPVRLINPEYHSLRRRFSIRSKNFSRDDERFAGLVRRRDHSFPRQPFRLMAR